jgi:hypothetical protein
MDSLTIKYNTYARALPPRPIQTADAPKKSEEGTSPALGREEPWLPFVAAATYGLELTYPYEIECQVIHDHGTIRFDWDFTKEPDGGLTGGEFAAFAPRHASKYYLFNTRLDLLPPPGYVLRTEPHPRFFTDDSGTVAPALIGHVQNEWYPRLLYVVFPTPRPGQRHIFRKGEPFAQVLLVPQPVNYETIMVD